jgi:hypothetical protein
VRRHLAGDIFFQAIDIEAAANLIELVHCFSHAARP